MRALAHRGADRWSGLLARADGAGTFRAAPILPDRITATTQFRSKSQQPHAAQTWHRLVRAGFRRQTLTFDPFKKMKRHADLAANTGVRACFCGIHSPGQSVTRENPDGLLRQ